MLGILLHRTWIGRQIYAIGKYSAASRFSGVRVARIRVALSVLSGVIAALAGVILTSRSRALVPMPAGPDAHGRAVVFLGGVNIFGGRGRSRASCLLS